MARQHKFVHEPDTNLICPICQDVAENPKQETNCGKIFCSSCIDKVKEQSCPHCRARPNYFEDTKSDREIKELVVECTNTEDGCSWKGPLRDEADHVKKSCDYQMVNCKHEDIGCSEETTRKRMREHEEDDIAHLPLFMDAVKKARDEKNVASGSGKIIIVENYKRLKQNERLVKSKPFYSHPNGYLMNLVVIPNGAHDGENSHVSVVVVISEGPHDKDLPWPFEGKITVTMLNQLQDDNHHVRTEKTDKDDGVTPFSIKTNGGVVFSSSKFISHASLNARISPLSLLEGRANQYLSNDTLYFQVSVETNKYKPWLNNNSSSAIVLTED